MEHQHWDTSTVTASQQFDLYRSGLCASFAHLTPYVAKSRDAFSASLDAWSDGARALTLISTQNHRVHRTHKDLKLVEDDHIYLNYVVQGQMSVRQGNMARCLRAGDFVFIDNARPFEAEINARSGHMHFALKLSRDAISRRLLTDQQTLNSHRAIPLIESHFSILKGASPTLRNNLVAPVLESLDAVLAQFAYTAEDHTTPERIVDTRDRTLSLIADQYFDPGLSLQTASRKLGLPQRTIQHHLSLLGLTFSDMLRDHRLGCARNEILKQSASIEPHMSMEAIGFKSGFADTSTFYRAFKRKYGVAPGHYCQKTGFLNGRRQQH
ncbi:MAG: helix-turn-helix transcriptional regulator [Pseudomonadota bacterium]